MYKRKDFIDKYYPIALEVTKNSGIFPETLLAMAIVESSGKVGKEYLVGANASARYANNYFGIKSSTAWKGATVKLSTPNDAQKTSTFRSYPTVKDSFIDYVKFLKVNPRYVKANVFNSEDYPTQIINIARAGYAENTQYADLVTNVANSVSKAIEKNIIKPIKDNKGIAGGLLTFFFLLLYLKHNDKI